MTISLGTLSFVFGPKARIRCRCQLGRAFRLLPSATRDLEQPAFMARRSRFQLPRPPQSGSAVTLTTDFRSAGTLRILDMGEGVRAIWTRNCRDCPSDFAVAHDGCPWHLSSLRWI